MLRASVFPIVVVVAALAVSGCGVEGGPSGASYPAPAAAMAGAPVASDSAPLNGSGPGRGGDRFAFIEEDDFQAVRDAPLSTFSIDVDTASYSKLRGFLLNHRTLPPPDAVRVEELINYFSYDYSGPANEHPLAVHIEAAQCPWQPKHRLVRFGIQAKQLEGKRPASNLVFLVDVSGSMSDWNRLPLVQRALKMLVPQLGANDRVSIVTYAGEAGVRLPPTSGADQHVITAAIERLRAGGSTNGGQGIQLAYQLAEENFIEGGVNRVLLCTDGDFNVGVTSSGELVRLATGKAKAGVDLSILGFGFGNHNDALLEQLSSKANGNYSFIDNEQEAYKVLVQQMRATLVTVAKDVKLQVEFNPRQVAAYRLIGYENRRLANRDFNNDRKDAGEVGAGHSVTALYEIVPADAESDLSQPEVDPLKYQTATTKPARRTRPKADGAIANELLTLKVRYQSPQGGPSTLLTFPLKNPGADFESASRDFRFATAVASFGMLLRNSKYKGDTSYAAVLKTALACRGDDRRGQRGEFLELVKAARSLDRQQADAGCASWQLRDRRVTVNPVVANAQGGGRFYNLDSLEVFVLGILAGGGIFLGLALLICLALILTRPGPIYYAVQPLHKLK